MKLLVMQFSPISRYFFQSRSFFYKTKDLSSPLVQQFLIKCEKIYHAMLQSECNFVLNSLRIYEHIKHSDMDIIVSGMNTGLHMN
jgi:hypothetical protein